MPTLQENIRIIQTAIYGKEMRPAIVEALTQSWDEVLNMENSVEELNKRVDSLSGGGGVTPSPNPDDPGSSDKPANPKECYIVDSAILSVDGIITDLVIASDADPF